MGNPSRGSGSGGGPTGGERLRTTMAEVDTLMRTADPESEPHRSKYAALELLATFRDETLAARGAGEDDAAAVDVALAEHRMGLIKLSADERSEGESLLQRAADAMQSLRDLTGIDFGCHLQEAHNALGIVWFERGATGKAFDHFKRAESIHLEGESERAQSGAIAADPKASGGDAFAKVPPRERHFCQTLYYLAQAYSNLGQSDEGAKYCALTLRTQLQCGLHATQDWAQNAVQLSGYHLDAGRFAAAHHLLRAAAEVMRTGAGNLKDVLPSGGDPRDVPANLDIGWGKFALARLVASRERRLAGAEGAPATDDGPLFELIEASLPPELTFESLGLEASPFLGTTALVANFEAARTVHNQGMTSLNAAMGHYRLEGWVTEHFHIAMDASALLKCLAEFEPDPHRRCVMHRMRAKRIEGIITGMNEKYFGNVWKSARLELADVYREIMETKEGASRPHAKIYKAGSESIRQYRAFLALHEKEEGGVESMGEDDTLLYIKGKFELGRLLHRIHRCQPASTKDRTACVAESLKHLQWIETFTAKHGERRHPQAKRPEDAPRDPPSHHLPTHPTLTPALLEDGRVPGASDEGQ